MKKIRLIFLISLLLIMTAVMCGCGEKSYFNSVEEKTEEKAEENSESREASGDEASSEDTSQREVVVKVYVTGDATARIESEDEGVTVVAEESGITQRQETSDTESTPGQTASDASSGIKNGLVDINLATKEELMTLSGIGATRAEAIISYRSESGSFGSIEDIKKVSGIGDGTYQKIKDKITI